MRLAVPIAIVLLAAALLGGCGGDSGGGAATNGDASAEGGAAAGADGAPAGAGVRDCAEGDAEIEELRATEIACAEARRLARTWLRREACALSGGASRAGCAIGPYRCLATRAARGVSVSCARPGHSAAFIVHR